MKKGRDVRLIAWLMMMSFISASLGAQVGSLDQDSHGTHNAKLHTREDAPQHSEDQFPYEQKENELEDKSETNVRDNNPLNNLVFICNLLRSNSLEPSDPNNLFLYDAPRGCGNATSIALFLSKRSLLI